MITSGDIFDKINTVAPFCFQEKWDNSGLLVGNRSKEIKKVLVCLDITKEIALEAVSENIDMVVSHHPVIFNPLYTLSINNPAVILASNNICAVCAHTNLDKARGGVNDIIADMFNAQIIKDTLDISSTQMYYQISVFVPVENVDEVYEAMSEAGAGKLGKYEKCAFSVNGEGRFTPLEGSDPYIGKTGIPEKVNEARLEMIVPHDRRSEVVSAMLEAHPYEKPAYSLFANHALEENYGYGKLMKLKKPLSVKDFAVIVKKTFDCRVLRYNDTEKMIEKFAFCSGSGGSFISKAFESGADAYVCGDVKHDQFIDAQNMGLAVFDAGHYDTEKVVLPYLVKVIKEVSDKIQVSISKSEKNIVNCL